MFVKCIHIFNSFYSQSSNSSFSKVNIHHLYSPLSIFLVTIFDFPLHPTIHLFYVLVWAWSTFSVSPHHPRHHCYFSTRHLNQILHPVQILFSPCSDCNRCLLKIQAVTLQSSLMLEKKIISHGQFLAPTVTMGRGLFSPLPANCKKVWL